MKKLLLLSSARYLVKHPEIFGKPLSDHKMLHVITASKGVTDLGYLERNRKYFDEQFAERLEYDLDGKTGAEVRETLGKFNLVYLEGGNSFYLIKSIRESGFEKVLREFLPKGLVYMGGSAGSYVACPTIEMALWRHQDKYDHYGVTDMTGMNLVPFLLSVHYKPEYDEMIKAGMARIKYPVRILTDEQALEVTDDSYKLVGEGGEIKLKP